MSFRALPIVLFISTIRFSVVGVLVNISSTEVYVEIGGTARIICSYPIYSDHSYPLIRINGSEYATVNEVRRLPQSRYSVVAVPNNDGTLCTLTLSYHNVTASDNGTSYRFLVFIGNSRETESDPVTLYVHEREHPPNSEYVEVVESIKDKETLLSSQTSSTVSVILKSTTSPPGGSAQLSTTAIIVIGVVCGGVCLVMLGIVGVTSIVVFCVRSGKVYSPKGEAVPEESLKSDDVKIEENPAYATVEYDTTPKTIYFNL